MKEYQPYTDVMYLMTGYLVSDVDEERNPQFDIFMNENILFRTLEEAERKITELAQDEELKDERACFFVYEVPVGVNCYPAQGQKVRSYTADGELNSEIKETSYYHSWQEKIAQGRISQQRTFGITPAYTKYKDNTTVLERQNDIYVFCLNTGNNEEESNPLEMTNCEFYVVPTAVINANCTPAQKSISLGKVRKLAPMTRFQDLKNVIDSICDK